MSQAPPPELIQKAANACATDQIEELRTLIPNQVPPDSAVWLYFLTSDQKMFYFWF